MTSNITHLDSLLGASRDSHLTRLRNGGNNLIDPLSHCCFVTIFTMINNIKKTKINITVI
eukprot:6363456-Amphidinium_carterae.1